MKPDAQDSQGSEGALGELLLQKTRRGVDGKDEGLGSAASPGGGLTEAFCHFLSRWGRVSRWLVLWEAEPTSCSCIQGG